MTIKDKITDKIFSKSLNVIGKKFFEYGDLIVEKVSEFQDSMGEISDKLKNDKIDLFLKNLWNKLKTKKEQETKKQIKV